MKRSKIAHGMSQTRQRRFCPRGGFNFGVTRWTDGDQIIEIVCFQIIFILVAGVTELAEGAEVVDV